MFAVSRTIRGIEAKSSAIRKEVFDAVGIGTESEGEYFRRYPKAVKIAWRRSVCRHVEQSTFELWIAVLVRCNENVWSRNDCMKCKGLGPSETAGGQIYFSRAVGFASGARQPWFVRTPPLAATMISAEFIFVRLAATCLFGGAAQPVVGGLSGWQIRIGRRERWSIFDKFAAGDDFVTSMHGCEALVVAVGSVIEGHSRDRVFQENEREFVEE